MNCGGYCRGPYARLWLELGGEVAGYIGGNATLGDGPPRNSARLVCFGLTGQLAELALDARVDDAERIVGRQMTTHFSEAPPPAATWIAGIQQV